MDDQNQVDQTQAVTTPVHVASNDEPGNDNQASADDRVIDSVRQQALDALMPVIDSIQGAPEHKFEILMSALQSSPTPALMQKALEAAQAIEDPSTKAEALVDLLNETNAI